MADKSVTANSWPAEGMPIDAACRSFMPELWKAYEQARTGLR